MLQKYKLNPALGNWVQHQRQNKKNGKLLEEEIAKLDDIGFAWVASLGRRGKLLMTSLVCIKYF
jgi:hypothetical protein